VKIRAIRGCFFILQGMHFRENPQRTHVLYFKPLFVVVVVACLILAGCASKTGEKSIEEQEIEALMQEMRRPENLMRKNRQTLLHLAAEEGKTNEVVQLLKQGVEVDSKDKWRRTPLHLAAEWGHVGIVKALLASGADVNAETRFAETPLFFALRYWLGDEDEQAGRAHWAELVNTLLYAGATFRIANSDGLTPLHLAASAKNGNSEILRLFIMAGANVNAAEEFGDTPLHFAANSGNADTAKLLLDAGANVHARGRGGQAPLHAASWHKGASAILMQAFIRAGADVNARDNEGKTPLHGMSPVGNSEWVSELLKAGADPNVKSNDGQTPLHKAAEAGRADIIMLLLDAKAAVNVADDEGRTPLDMATQPMPLVQRKSMKKCIALLKKRGGQNGLKPEGN
jgi:ankyrin repeat protein